MKPRSFEPETLAPDAELLAGTGTASTLVIACGALARELVAVVRMSDFRHLAITCLPAILHNHPERIAPAVRAKVRANRARHDRILCLYGDCGTGGELDAMLAEEGVERIEGAHCYEFYFGAAAFADAMVAEPGTFFFTDYLVRHFDRLIWQGLGLDRFPELLATYFGNYTRALHLTQVDDPDLSRKAQAAASRLGLEFDARATGLAGVRTFLDRGLAPNGVAR